eukprot:CAMPEP_0185542196 /NCGR_PEP_ID=MMETSP1381-20130426/2471_1 /TAXON_ID=298111 /ORGANISM="Pavlova sp., Strain CCMP459" /LENGTH=106 /DNA_ID=CAMNT_0028154169 /DNA_START=29 /DNA_END=349 /DNA_ORIENTATION=-
MSRPLFTLCLLLCVIGASAFSPVGPVRASRVVSRQVAVTTTDDIVMMPKFLKKLFPNAEKPDDALGGLKKMFGGKSSKADDLPVKVDKEECIADAENAEEIQDCKE